MISSKNATYPSCCYYKQTKKNEKYEEIRNKNKNDVKTQRKTKFILRKK